MKWWVLLYALMSSKCDSFKENEDFKTISISRLASHTYGTELLLLDNEYNEQSYRFEDFFWTGSGDGSDIDENSIENEMLSTIYETKTVVSTVYLETSTVANNTIDTNNITKCVGNCEKPIEIPDQIKPTPTFHDDDSLDDEPSDADKEFWLLTVLKSNGDDPVISDLKNSLAKLYKTAFQRQQDRHLGIGKRIKRSPDEPVNIYIHSMKRINQDGEDNLQVLYHVLVSGKPVPAVTAAEDMSLIPDDEVVDELGYPLVIKAEPYIKSPSTENLINSKSTWLFISISIISLLILLLIIAFLIIGINKRKAKEKLQRGLENRRDIFENQISVNKSTKREPISTCESPTYINYRKHPTVKSGVNTNLRPRSTTSCSTSSSSTTSLDISPLMNISKQKTPPKKPPRPKAALNKTAPVSVHPISKEFFDSDSNGSRGRSPETIFVGNYDPGVVSPKSYLSMPSVKSFPRGSMPEPLNKVLEPVSVLHLDMTDDEALENASGISAKTSSTFLRHGSVGTVADPGVLGPVVWDWHCQRLQHGISVDEGINELKIDGNITKIRRRFHDLLDDTFSLFGSRRGSPLHNESLPSSDVMKSKSAVNTRSREKRDVEIQPHVPVRPKTSDPRQIQAICAKKPRGAWSSVAPSPLIRPLSAGPIYSSRPLVNVDHVLAEGNFSQNDPAGPLIEAIKSEIQKCSLPGSTNDLKMV